MNTISTQESAQIIPGPGASPVPGRSMGAMLMDAGKLSPEDGERILRYAREKGLRFGDAAVALKLVSQDDIAEVLAHQFDYPYLRKGESSVSPEVIAAWSPFTAPVEALRAIRSQLMLRWFGEGERKCLAVVSPGRSEGRSHIAANLAVVFAQMGARTLLIDADLRNPRQHVLFGLHNGTGLSTILADRADRSVVQGIAGPLDLSVLTGGASPPNPSELLNRNAFSALLADLSAGFDVIILDAPAAQLGADAQLIALRSNGALLVARRNRTSIDDCRDLAEAIRTSGSTVVGSVINEA